MSADLLDRVKARLDASPLFRCSRNDQNQLVIVGREETWSVLITEYHDATELAAVFLARIGDERIASPERVLRLAGKIGAGALALVGASYVVRYTVPASAIMTAPLETIVMYLHGLATSLERELTATARDVTGLAHLAH